MSCVFCIVAVPPSSGRDNRGLLVASKLGSGGASLTRALDTESVELWRGRLATGGPPVAVTLTLYKAARRVRAQIMSHELTDEEQGRLEDAIVRAVSGTLVSRHSPSAGAHRVPSSLERLVPRGDYWPSWLPPPGFESHPGALPSGRKPARGARNIRCRGGARQLNGRDSSGRSHPAAGSR
jgi:hypothetical protein